MEIVLTIIFGVISSILAWLQVEQNRAGKTVLSRGKKATAGGLALKAPTILRHREYVVCTDARFLDSSLFLMATRRAATRLKRTTLVLTHREWSRVPTFIGSEENAIGYFNRRSAYAGHHVARVESWGNLCIYKGYSILGRQTAELSATKTLSDANAAIANIVRRSKSHGKRPIILTMGADALWRFPTPFLKDFRIDDYEIREDDVESAADRFLEGEGDLFIGGLPQRLRCMRAGGLVEIVTSEIDPTLFAVNSIIVKRSCAIPPEVLATIFDEWASCAEALDRSEAFVEDVFEHYVRTTHELGAGAFRTNKDIFHYVLSQKKQIFLEFFSRMNDSSASLLLIQKQALGLAKSINMSLTDLEGVMSSIASTYQVTLE